MSTIAQAFRNFFSFFAGGAQPQVRHVRRPPVAYSKDEKVAAKLKEFADLREAREGGWGETQFLQR